MTDDELFELLGCRKEGDTISVRSRERSDLEFKSDGQKNTVLKSIKTIAAFANRKGGGNIVFGVAEKPRRVCGIEEFPDEAMLQDTLTKHLFPVPDIEVFEHTISGLRLVRVNVAEALKAPVIAIKDLQTSEEKNKTLMRQGTVYYRRAGRSQAVSGEEFAAILERRDDSIRQSILGLLTRAEKIGFDNVTIADFRKYGKKDENVTLYVPVSAANELNIIDRAKLVQDDGAPAYQIRGSVRLTSSTDLDPRKPLLPSLSARALKSSIQKVFWPNFPWGPIHLRKAASHLGFWDKDVGDGVNTGVIEVTGDPVYYESGRHAVKRFAETNPDDFVDVIGSKETKAKWQRHKLGASRSDEHQQ